MSFGSAPRFTVGFAPRPAARARDVPDLATQLVDAEYLNPRYSNSYHAQFDRFCAGDRVRVYTHRSSMYYPYYERFFRDGVIAAIFTKSPHLHIQTRKFAMFIVADLPVAWRSGESGLPSEGMRRHASQIAAFLESGASGLDDERRLMVATSSALETPKWNQNVELEWIGRVYTPAELSYPRAGAATTPSARGSEPRGVLGALNDTWRSLTTTAPPAADPEPTANPESVTILEVRGEERAPTSARTRAPSVFSRSRARSRAPRSRWDSPGRRPSRGSRGRRMSSWRLRGSSKILMQAALNHRRRRPCRLCRCRRLLRRESRKPQ